MLRFFVRVVLGASALTWNSCAASNNLGSPMVMNYNGVACDQELHVTTEALCFQAAEKFKLKKTSSINKKKFPYGCSLRGKLVNFSSNKSAGAPKMVIKSICMSPPICGTSEPTVEPSMNPSNELSMEPTKVPSTPLPSSTPTIGSTCVTFCDQRTFFTFNGPKQITSASNVGDFTDLVAKPPMDYVLRFTIKPTGVSNNGSNIMHFTTGGPTCCTWGSEGLEVFFWTNNSISVRIKTSTGSATINTNNGLTLNTDYDVKIHVVGTLTTISIDGVVYSTVTTAVRSQLSDVQVYISDPWTISADAIISNVYFGTV